MNTMGVILAGGKSSRMGRDKAYLDWNGKTLLEFQIEKLGKIVGSQNVVISGDRSGFNSVVDSYNDRGPVEGLKSVLKRAETGDSYSRVLVIPIDMPLLSVGLLAFLCRKMESYDAVKFRHFQFPVLFQNLPKMKEKLVEMEAELNRGGIKSEYSFSNLYKKLNVLEMAMDERAEFLNANTPEEWEIAISKADRFK